MDSTRFIFLQFLISILFISLASTNSMKGHVEVDHNGYPTWLSSGDRMLVSQLEGGRVQPNVVVAKDGSGQYKTVTDGINSYPINYQERYVIYVKAGIYEEYVIVDQNKTNILLYGDGPTNTIITGNKNYNDGLQMPQTATFSSLGKDFIAEAIAFENTAGPQGKQAVALRVAGDRSAFFNCTFRGYQDTLYVNVGRQFYRNCEITGTIDFIYGQSTTLIQNSTILVRKPSLGQENVVVADGSEDNNNKTGIVLQNCSIIPDVELIPFQYTVKTYLARPWKPFSRAIFINNFIDGFIQRDGYMIWNKTNPNIENSYFAEFGNIGPGAIATSRVKWAKGVISKDEAAKFTVEPWIKGSTWLPSTHIPYDSGLQA